MIIRLFARFIFGACVGISPHWVRSASSSGMGELRETVGSARNPTGTDEYRTMVQLKIRVAIAGVGNCASALLQGIEFYRETRPAPRDGFIPGLMNRDIGGYLPGDIEVVAAFDIDRRKVGRPVTRGDLRRRPTARSGSSSACPPGGPVVQMGPSSTASPPHGRLPRRPDVPPLPRTTVRRGAGPARVRRRDPGQLPAGRIGGGHPALRRGVPPRRA